MAREALFETPVGYEFYRNAVYYAADPAGPGTLAQRLEVLRYVLGAKGACPRRLFVCYLVSLHGRTIRQVRPGSHRFAPLTPPSCAAPNRRGRDDRRLRGTGPGRM